MKLRILSVLALAVLLTPVAGFAGISAPGGSTGGSVSLQGAFALGKEITGANSRANAFCVGDGSIPICIYTDATLGPLIRPKTDANARTYIWPGYTWSLYDLGNTSDMITASPDAIAANSGTITIASNDQLRVSNYGLELLESDTNPPCAAGNFNIFADASENSLKQCENGITTKLGGDTYVRKTANETVNNSTSLQNDDHLVFPVLANTTYAVQLFIMYDSSTTADLQYSFTLPASATGFKTTTNAPTSTTTCSGTSATLIFNSLTQTNNSIGGAGTGTANTCALVIDATVIVAGTAGNVQFRWAQANLDATDSIIRAGSWLRYRPLQ